MDDVLKPTGSSCGAEIEGFLGMVLSLLILSHYLFSSVWGTPQASNLLHFRCVQELQGITAHLSMNSYLHFKGDIAFFPSWQDVLVQNKKERRKVLWVFTERQSFAFDLKNQGGAIAFTLFNDDPRQLPKTYSLNLLNSIAGYSNFTDFQVGLSPATSRHRQLALLWHNSPMAITELQGVLRTNLQEILSGVLSGSAVRSDLNQGNLAFCRSLGEPYSQQIGRLEKIIDHLEALSPSPAPAVNRLPASVATP